MQYLNAFLCGGVLCAVGQVLLDRTKLTPARILVCYVTAGVLLGGLGLYAPLVEWAGAGATVPLTGFGFTLVERNGEDTVWELDLTGYQPQNHVIKVVD